MQAAVMHETFNSNPLTILAMEINKEWHQKNKMPKNAKFEERVKWHLAHQKNCKCMPIPEKLLTEMIKKGIKH